ncbi:hypothetical protein [Streptococcus oralis]|uniref:Anti-bacteriophage protein A/HamA C-terminal domain-containing protein n=1 Tax=Streptococcus oralis TaxID=1303 RepID=A0A139NWP2_STROR|nr:hypothetical protein [Streptococcus oralis]KXT80415.1 hypothetical protein SORDD15_01340 [Streptococcus oralis]
MLLGNEFKPISQVTSPSTLLNSKPGKELEVLVAVLQEELTEDEFAFIQTKLVEIAKGVDSTFSCETVALKIYNSLFKSGNLGAKTLKSRKHIIGFAAEFFLICILREQGYQQEFCYRNLEENSAKKGFDGLYSKDDEMWLVESKSTYSEETHESRIVAAYNGLNSQLSGQTSNDPWENAASHAKNARPNNSLTKRLEEYSESYMNGNFITISDSNIILGSTVVNEELVALGDEIHFHNYVEKHQARKENIIAINLTSEDLFIKLLERLKNES